MVTPLSLPFKRYVLKNGLTVYWQKRPQNWLAAKIIVRAGYRYERPEARHAAHVLEHMLFCGTAGYDYPRHDFVAFEHWCATQGFLLVDATTDEDVITVDGRAPLANSRLMLRTLADLVLHPTLEHGLEKERGIIRAERDEDLDATRRRHDRRIYRAAFGEHPAARFLPWPEDEALDALTYADLREFHGRTFHPQNMSLVVVASEPFTKWRSFLEEAFAVADQSFTRPADAPPFNPGPPLEREIFTGEPRRRKLTVELNYLWFLAPGNYPALDVAALAIEDVLMHRIRERMRATYDVSVQVNRSLDFTQVDVGTKIPKRHYRAARRVIESALTDLRAVRAQIGPQLVWYRLDRAMEDASVTEAMAEAEGLIKTDRRPASSNEAALERLTAEPERVVRFIKERLPLKRAIISVFETEV